MTLITENGAVADGSNAYAAIDATLQGSDFIEIPQGKFAVGQAVILDNSAMPGETEAGPAGKVIRGQDARQSSLRALPSIPSGSSVTIIKYGTGSSAHADHQHGGFSIIGNGVCRGLAIYNAAYSRIRDMTLRGCQTGLFLESVLSSSFRDMRIDNCQFGVSASKDDGFSHINALTFDTVTISDAKKLAYAGRGPHHSFNYRGGTIENCGTHGDTGAGGIFINFDGGSEGGVGAVIDGVYFEGNKGAADIRLENLGSARITVVISGCTFNRTSSAGHVINNIFAIGNINLVLIGNGFKGLGSYVPSASRPCLSVTSGVNVSGFGNAASHSVDSAALP